HTDEIRAGHARPRMSRRWRSRMSDHRGARQMTDTKVPPVAERIDPVCGMTVDPADAAGAYEYRGTTYYFCNLSCLERFKEAPDQFLGGSRPVIEAESYTCPMHPEIVRDRPGACPICGMALEPRVVGLEEKANPELIDMTRRFWIALPLAAPVFVLTMGDMVL